MIDLQDLKQKSAQNYLGRYRGALNLPRKIPDPRNSVGFILFYVLPGARGPFEFFK